MFNSPIYPETQGKIIQADYDTSIGNDKECMVCLTQGQVNAILAIVEYFGWRRRWYSDTQEIDVSQLQIFTNDITRRLINMCCCGDNQNTSYEPRDYFVRVDDDGFQEVSDDGGATWEVDTNSDYRFNGGLFPRPDPETLGDDEACTYTLNLLLQIQNAQIRFNDAWDVSEELTALIAAITSVLATWGLVLTGLLPAILITAIVVSVLAVGRTLWNAAFTGGFYDELKCSIYDNMPANGVWSPANWSALLVSIDAQPFSIARVWTWNLVKGMGAVGLSNASAIPAYSEDTCDECGDGWCVDDDFSEAQYSWVPRSVGGHDYASWAGTYFDAVTLSWNSPPANDDSSVQIEKTGLGQMERMTMFYTGAPNSIDVEFYLSGSLVYTHSLTGSWSGVEFTFAPVEFDMVRPVLYNTSGGGMTMTRVIMAGQGAPPFSGGDCE